MERTVASPQAPPSPRRLQPPSSQVYDLISVGFGTSSLALAAAIRDNNPSSNVLFLEQNSQFNTNDVAKSSCKHMQTSFMHDLATLRDPTSKYTFLNYLQAHGNLDKFIGLSNEGSMAPLRSDFCEYLQWAAGDCVNMVRFGSEVIGVLPISSSRWAIASKHLKTGETHVMVAKKVVYANGGQARIEEQENPEQSEDLQMFQVSDAMSKSYGDNQVSPDAHFTTLCSATVDIYNKVFADAEPLFIRALL